MFSTRRNHNLNVQHLKGSLELEIRIGERIRSVTHSNDWIIAATESSLRVFSAITKMEYDSIPCPDVRYMAIFESKLLTISGLGLIVTWDLERSNGILSTSDIPPEVVSCCTTQFDGRIRIYCGFKKGVIRLYEWKDDCINELDEMSTGSTEWISCLTYLPVSRLLAAGSWDSRVYLIDETGTCQRTLQQTSAPLSILSHNSNSFICGAYDGSVTLHSFSLPSTSW